MKNMIKTFALAAIAALALTGCIKHEPYNGHRPDDGGGSGHGGGGTPSEEKLVLRERTDWKATFLGRTVRDRAETVWRLRWFQRCI